MEHNAAQGNNPVRTIVGLNLNPQDAKRRLAQLDRATAQHSNPNESQSSLLDRARLQGEVDYCIAAINELKAQR